MKRSTARVALLLSLVALPACPRGNEGADASGPQPDGAAVRTVPAGALPGHSSLAEDDSPKNSPRLVPVEVYLRTYLRLFGGLAPADFQSRAQMAGSSLFDTWNDYLSALGMPDYRIDLPRVTQTNALMLATFERTGVALCDMAALNDLAMGSAPASRTVFTFGPTATNLSQADFATNFDRLHRLFLGYPARLASTPRADRFFQLYQTGVSLRSADGGAGRLTAMQAGWAAVCYGLVRHPEFHLY